LVALSFFGLSKELALAGVSSTLGFLCFWCLWSQMTGGIYQEFFKVDDQVASKSYTYLTLIATHEFHDDRFIT
jgi:hypothetical protein